MFCTGFIYSSVAYQLCTGFIYSSVAYQLCTGFIYSPVAYQTVKKVNSDLLIETVNPVVK